MRECPRCGNAFPGEFEFCPADGSRLHEGPDGGETPVAGERKAERQPLSIPVRTLFLALGGLILAAAAGFSVVFLYQYWKPKHGSLVIKTTPPGAAVLVDGLQRGISPVSVAGLRAGGHQVRIVKEGYKDLLQQAEVMPYAANTLHWNLQPLVPQLSNEQLAEVETWRKKLDAAQREGILLPPPDDYNVLHFAGRILAIDPANAYALDIRNKLAESVRQAADLAYAREDWLEAEKQYEYLALIHPDEISIGERLADIAAKLDATVKDREAQIEGWRAKAEAAFGAGNLIPPGKDNALDAIRSIQRLDRNSEYARKALAQVRDAIQGRGDSKIAAGDWQGARQEFRTVLQYFPDDPYSKSRLALVESKAAEAAQAELQRQQSLQEEQQVRQRHAALRQSALNLQRAGSYQKAIAEWLEYLKAEPNSDEANYYIGIGNVELKQLDTAILYFERCVALNPDHAPAHLNLGLLYDRHRKDLKRAGQHLRRTKELGGAERYAPDRLEAMIQDLQQRGQVEAMHNVPFAVEHKHTFSSCRGNLRLTESGAEYKTTENDHSFFEPYKGLQSLTVTGDTVDIRTSTNRRYRFRLLNPGDAVWIRRLRGDGP